MPREGESLLDAIERGEKPDFVLGRDRDTKRSAGNDPIVHRSCDPRYAHLAPHRDKWGNAVTTNASELREFRSKVEHASKGRLRHGLGLTGHEQVAETVKVKADQKAAEKAGLEKRIQEGKRAIKETVRRRRGCY